MRLVRQDGAASSLNISTNVLAEKVELDQGLKQARESTYRRSINMNNSLNGSLLNASLLNRTLNI
jgi:hypothetical protein